MTAFDVAGVVLGAVLGAAGLWVLWGRKAIGPGGLSEPTRLVLGLSLLVGGYHLVSYSLPGGTLPLRVPADRWWLLGLGIAVALGSSLALDAMEGGKDAG
ncbi:MAG: hypothetical protein ACF8Q5_07880 [Phycisphaerales bacterium JB040]